MEFILTQLASRLLLILAITVFIYADTGSFLGFRMEGSTLLLLAVAGVVTLGGVEIGSDTLLRWYVLHVLMLPFVIVIFMAIHFWRVRKDGGISGPL